MLQLPEQFEDLCLHGDIQGSGWLVGHDEPRIQRQCRGNDDALLLPSRELVRVVIHPVLRVRDPHLGQRFDGAGLGLFAADPVPGSCVGANPLDDLPAHGVDRIQRGGGFLEDHRDIAAPQATQFVGTDGEDIRTVDQDDPRTGGRFRQKSQNRLGRDRLARTGFADDRDDFAGLDVQIDVVDRVDIATIGREGHLEPRDG